VSASQAAIATSEVVTATRLNNYPQGVLQYTPSTANASATSGTTELDVLTASAVTVTDANRRLKITWHCRGISATVGGSTDVYTVRIKEGSTTLGESNYLATATAVAATGGCDFSAFVDSPSAGSHTYKVTIQRAIGSGSATVQGLPAAPMYIAVEDVGLA
jgi:hypothetical protein